MDNFFFVESDAIRKKKKSGVILMDDYSDVTDDENDVIDIDDAQDDNDTWTFSEDDNGEVRAEFDAAAYMHKLLQHYQSLPAPHRVDADDYAVIHVNPSVIPTFFPALRIYKYNTTEVLDDRGSKSIQNYQDPFDIDLENIEQDDFDLEDVDSDADYWVEYDDEPAEDEVELARKRHNRTTAPLTNAFLTPLGYVQYFLNLTKANLSPNVLPEYEVEYTTWDDYDMSDLTVPSWLRLARRIAKHGWRSKLWRKVKRHLLVSTRHVIKQRKGGPIGLNGGDGSNGPLDYIESELSF